MVEAPEDIAKLMQELETLREREREITEELTKWLIGMEHVAQRLRSQVIGEARQALPQTARGATKRRKKRKKVTQKGLIVDIVTDLEKPVRADKVHQALRDEGHEMDLRNVRSYLAHAAKEGLVERIAPGLYGPVGSAGKTLLDDSD